MSKLSDKQLFIVGLVFGAVLQYGIYFLEGFYSSPSNPSGWAKFAAIAIVFGLVFRQLPGFKKEYDKASQQDKNRNAWMIGSLLILILVLWLSSRT